MTTRVRRAISLAGAGALAAGIAVALPLGSAQAATDPAPAAEGVAWLADQRGDDGLLAGDATVTMDFGVGLARTGLASELLPELRTAVDGVLTETIGEEGDTSAYGRVAAATLFYAYAGEPTDAAGIDLKERLEGLVNDATGELETNWGGTDLYNQSTAVLALNMVESSEAPAATQFLLDGRCEGAGWGFEDGVGGDCISDVDTTALALTALSEQEGAAAETAVSEGTTWLLTQQAADGSFGLSQYTPYNANSTGLAGWALFEVGEEAAATEAAVWVRSHQLAGATDCEPGIGTDRGAIAHNDDDLMSAAADGIGAGEREIFVRAASQALSVLVLAPAAEGDLAVTGTKGFVKAGSTTSVIVEGVAPGERACVTGGKQAVTATGPGTVDIIAKAGTGERTITLTTGDATATTSVSVLGKATLKVKAKKKVKKGKKAKVTVKGLAAGEKVKVTHGGKKVAKGKANAKGIFKKKIKVGKKTGKVKIKAVGQFANRKGTTKIRVR